MIIRESLSGILKMQPMGSWRRCCGREVLPSDVVQRGLLGKNDDVFTCESIDFAVTTFLTSTIVFYRTRVYQMQPLNG